MQYVVRLSEITLVTADSMVRGRSVLKPEKKRHGPAKAEVAPMMIRGVSRGRNYSPSQLLSKSNCLAPEMPGPLLPASVLTSPLCLLGEPFPPISYLSWVEPVHI